MESGLTYEEIVEILLRQEELLELYRSQLKAVHHLSKDLARETLHLQVLQSH